MSLTPASRDAPRAGFRGYPRCRTETTTKSVFPEIVSGIRPQPMQPFSYVLARIGGARQQKEKSNTRIGLSEHRISFCPPTLSDVSWDNARMTRDVSEVRSLRDEPEVHSTCGSAPTRMPCSTQSSLPYRARVLGATEGAFSRISSWLPLTPSLSAGEAF